MKKSVFYIGIFLSTIVIGGVSSPIFAAGKYTGEIDACIKANKEGRAKSIEEYVCPVGTLKPQQIAFQVIMSIEFKKLDEEVKKDLKAIHDGTNKDI